MKQTSLKCMLCKLWCIHMLFVSLAGSTPTGNRLLVCTEKYKEALLDDEVGIYTCSYVHGRTVERQRDLVDPVGTCLLHGDSQVTSTVVL